MSLLSNSSIALLPDGGKAGKLYSLIPSDGSGDFTVVRALDTATRVNENGLIEVVPANVPRIDFAEGTGCGSLLVEPTRTNNVLYSNDFNQYNNSNTSFSQNELGIDGTNSGWTLTNLTGVGRLRAVITTTSNENYIISFWAKTGSSNTIRIKNASATALVVDFNLDTQSIIQATGTEYVSAGVNPNPINGYYRYWVKILTSISTIPEYDIVPALEINGTNIITEFQIEKGNYLTSNILTSGGTEAERTRNADVISLTGVPELLSDSEGTLFAEIKHFQDINIISVNDGSFVDSVCLATLFGEFRLLIKHNNNIISNTAGTVDYNVFYKESINYKSGDNSFFLDGNLLISNTKTLAFQDPLSAVAFNRELSVSGGAPFYGRIKSLLVYQAALDTDASEVLSGYATFEEIATNKNYIIL